MSITKLDPEMMLYFLRQGRDVGFIRECINSTPIQEKAMESGLSVEHRGEITFDGITATVYALPRSSMSVFMSGSDSDGCSENGYEAATTPEIATSNEFIIIDAETEDQPDDIFLAELTDSSIPEPEDYCTYVYDSEPDMTALKQTHNIQTLKHELCFGDLEPTYVCQGCNTEVHWLCTPQKQANPLRALPGVKLHYLRQRLCGQKKCEQVDADGSSTGSLS